MENSQEQPLPATLSPNSENVLQWTPECNSQSRPWGQLILNTKKIKTLGIKHSYNPGDISSYTFDLHKDTYTVGKENCDITLNSSHFSSDILSQISRKHFILRRNLDEHGPVILEDVSHNGTCVNGEKIGRGNKRIIESLDEIILGVKYQKVFVFHDWLITSNVEAPTCIKYVYFISKQIGNGASAVVNLVYHKRSCKQYAMKIIAKDVKVGGHDSLNNPTRIMNEVKLMKSLKHPFVVLIENIVDTPKTLFLVMEYMENSDLQHYVVEKSRLEEEEAKHIFYQIAEAVKYLHNKKIIHRDLKPQNILLRKCSKYTIIAKLSDFGLSKFIDDTYLKTKCGTPLYNAPEIIRSSEGYTEKADIWSLGIILYFTLSGKEPFSRTEVENEIFNALYSFDDQIWHSTSLCAQDLINKIIVLDYKKRFSITDVLEHEWLKNDMIIKEILYPNKQQSKMEKSKSLLSDNAQTRVIVKNELKPKHHETSKDKEIIYNNDSFINKKKQLEHSKKEEDLEVLEVLDIEEKINNDCTIVCPKNIINNIFHSDENLEEEKCTTSVINEGISDNISNLRDSECKDIEQNSLNNNSNDNYSFRQQKENEVNREAYLNVIDVEMKNEEKFTYKSQVLDTEEKNNEYLLMIYPDNADNILNMKENSKKSSENEDHTDNIRNVHNYESEDNIADTEKKLLNNNSNENYSFLQKKENETKEEMLKNVTDTEMENVKKLTVNSDILDSEEKVSEDVWMGYIDNILNIDKNLAEENCRKSIVNEDNASNISNIQNCECEDNTIDIEEKLLNNELNENNSFLQKEELKSVIDIEMENVKDFIVNSDVLDNEEKFSEDTWMAYPDNIFNNNEHLVAENSTADTANIKENTTNSEQNFLTMDI